MLRRSPFHNIMGDCGKAIPHKMLHEIMSHISSGADSGACPNIPSCLGNPIYIRAGLVLQSESSLIFLTYHFAYGTTHLDSLKHCFISGGVLSLQYPRFGCNPSTSTDGQQVLQPWALCLDKVDNGGCIELDNVINSSRVNKCGGF